MKFKLEHKYPNEIIEDQIAPWEDYVPSTYVRWFEKWRDFIKDNEMYDDAYKLYQEQGGLN